MCTPRPLAAPPARLTRRRARAAPQACDPDTDAGDWIARIDLVEKGRALTLAEQSGPGKCGTECRTVARACADVLGDHDTDLAEAVFTAAPGAAARAWLEGKLCRELSSVCAKPPPPLPASRPRGPAFEPKSEQEVEMDRMMRSMAGIPGMPGARAGVAGGAYLARARRGALPPRLPRAAG